MEEEDNPAAPAMLPRRKSRSGAYVVPPPVSACLIVKPGDEIGHRGFASTGCSDQRDNRAFRDLQIHIK
jgi:hypothetical protein